MRSLLVFESLTLNGYFTDARNSLDWAHRRDKDADYQKFVQGNASKPAVMLFGRVTYDMMKAWWPTPQAKKSDPEVAKGMNEAEKIVFSRTLEKADWANTRVVNDDLVGTVRKLKQQDGKDLVLMGSGSIVAQLAEAGLIDTFMFVVNPVALGEGRTLFEGVKREVSLELKESRAFKNGFVVLTYGAA